MLTLSGRWLDAVCDIERLCYVSPWSRESLEHALNGGYQSIGICDSTQQLRAYLIYSRVEDELHILNLAVHPQARRQQLGSYLLAWLHAFELKHGARMVFLEVSRNNQAARKLYSKFGYQQIGTRKAYYRDTQDDALILKKQLNN